MSWGCSKGQTEVPVKTVVGTRVVSSEHFTASSLLGLPGYENSPEAVLNVDLNLNTQLLVPAWRCGSRGWLCGCQESPPMSVMNGAAPCPVRQGHWPPTKVPCGRNTHSWASWLVFYTWNTFDVSEVTLEVKTDLPETQPGSRPPLFIHPFSSRTGHFWTSTHSQSEPLFLLEMLLCVPFILSVSIWVCFRLTFKNIHIAWAEWRTGTVIVQ